MTVPKIYVVEGLQLKAWAAPNSFNLTFDETSTFIHDLQNAMTDLRHLENRTALDFSILVLPKKEI